MQNILIVGLGKSGTTGLYERIKRSVADHTPAYQFVFEPTDGRPFRALPVLAPDRPILSKTMFLPIVRGDCDLDLFSHRILIVRDPRDMLVSQLLFRPLVRGSVVNLAPESLHPFVDALRRKEADPGAVSVVELQRIADAAGIRGSIWKRVGRQLKRLMAFEADGAFHRVTYEDFVANRLSDLESYLGLDLGSEDVPAEGWLGHITRSRSSDGWRDWFTPDDVTHFRPAMQPFLDYFGYGNDWSLSAAPDIPAESSSAYVVSRFAARRTSIDLRSEFGHLDLDEAALQTLRQMTSDGDPRAAVRLARHMWKHTKNDRRADAALEVARSGARLGFPPAMGLLVSHTSGPERAFWRTQERYWSAVPPGSGQLDRWRHLRRSLAVEKARLAAAQPTIYGLCTSVINAGRRVDGRSRELVGEAAEGARRLLQRA